jgi:hypothetical protein
VIAGRLTTATNRPIADARIGVLAADASAPERGNSTVGEVRTDRQGRFATAVALDRGAPRKLLTFTYLAHRGDQVPAATARSRLEVAGAISARASMRETRRGASVPLEGRSSGEASVQILVRQPGSRAWRISSSAQATRTGRWEASVYIPSYAPRGTYRLRARVLGDTRRGFLSGESQQVTVQVR